MRKENNISNRKALFGLKQIINVICIFLFVSIIVSCVDDNVGSSWRTAEEFMIGEFLTESPVDSFSEFTKLLDTTEILGLLNAYGEYTCFAPTNEAMFEYYKKFGKESLEDFDMDSLNKIAKDHVIKDNDIASENFVNGRLDALTMSRRYISIGFEKFPIFSINGESDIIRPDIKCHNGYVHAVNKVVNPSDETVIGLLEKDSLFTLFFNAIRFTGYSDELRLIEDTTYNIETWEKEYTLGQNNGNDEELPEYRPYGFTLLVESDSTYKANGIENLDELRAYASQVYDEVYPEDADVDDEKDPRNSLNRYVAYHIINKNLSYNKFIIDYDEKTGLVHPQDNVGKSHQFQGARKYDMYEYFETLCENTLIEVRTDKDNGRTNLFNWMNENDGIQIVNSIEDGINGVYHEIDNLLTFNNDYVSYLSSKRLRMDAASFFPELANYNMRANGAIRVYVIPPGYFKRLNILSDNTKYIYLNSDSRYEDYQGDEMFLSGLYDFEIETPPVPAGTYEVRFSFQPTPFRGVAQLYWDGLPCGIPLDLTLNADDASIGHVVPGEDDDDPEGFENDKMMRNRGYMKGPASYHAPKSDWYLSANARVSVQSLRVILGIYTFDEMTTHKFKVTGYKVGQFMFDFLEFCPTEVIEYEDIY